MTETNSAYSLKPPPTGGGFPYTISLYIAGASDLETLSATWVTSTFSVRWPKAISSTSPTLT